MTAPQYGCAPAFLQRTLQFYPLESLQLGRCPDGSDPDEARPLRCRCFYDPFVFQEQVIIKAEQALDEILLIGIDEQPEEVLMLKARALVEKFKADLLAAHHGLTSTETYRLHVADELAKLRDAVDQEIDRRVDEDLADTVCDLLEHLSDHLHAETRTPAELAAARDATVASNITSSDAEHRRAQIAEVAYLRAAQRHFEPGHDVEDWLAAERALGLR